MSNTINSQTSSTYATSTDTSLSNNTSKPVTKLPAELKTYLDDAETDGKNLAYSLKKLLKEGNSDNTKKSAEDVIKYYNNLISKAKSSKDEGLKYLANKCKKIIGRKSDELADLGIKVTTDGKIKISDKDKFNQSISKGKMKEFIEANKANNELFGKAKSMANKIIKDNTSYLSDVSKLLIERVNREAEMINSGNTQTSTTEETEAANTFIGQNLDVLG